MSGQVYDGQNPLQTPPQLFPSENAQSAQLSVTRPAAAMTPDSSSLSSLARVSFLRMSFFFMRKSPDPRGPVL
jgi:hypothetical protein